MNEVCYEIRPSYEVGDIVHILPKYLLKSKDVNFGFDPDMGEYCDLIVKILQINKIKCLKTGRMEPSYIFADVPSYMNNWCWGEDMFELVEPVKHENDKELTQSWFDILQ